MIGAKGKVYCFFEQSGTFKNEFRKLADYANRFIREYILNEQ